MDPTFFKLILRSCKDAVKEIEETEDYQKLDSAEIFAPSSEAVFNALSTSLTHLLSHKVSKEAHQRYSVRLNVIDVLRNWCSVPEYLRSLHTLRSNENMLTFLSSILENCMTDEVLKLCADAEDLIPLTNSLICLLPKNPKFINHIDRLLRTLIEMEPTEECDQFLCNIVKNRNHIPIPSPTIELIYKMQCHRLIEEPVLNNLAKIIEPADKDTNDFSLNEIVELCAEFPSIFQLVCLVLKELFVKLNFARPIIDYTRTILTQVELASGRQGKQTLELYPRNLHAVLILLKIEPSHHSERSKRYTLQTLAEIWAASKDDALILLSHFPVWLKDCAAFIEEHSESIVN